MSKEVSQSYFNKQINRRTLLKAGGILASTSVIYAGRQGITFKPLPDEYGEVIPEQYDELSTFKPVTIAHRAGNTIEGIRRAKEAGITSVDIDVTVAGNEMYAEHGSYKSFGKVVIGGFDLNTWKVQIGRPNLLLEEALEVASGEGRRAFLELKRGDFSTKRIQKIFNKADNLGLPVVASCNDFETVDRVRYITGDPEHVVYVPKWPEWNKIFNERDKEDRRHALTNALTAKNIERRLKEYEVTAIIGDVNSSQQVLELRSRGFDRYMNSRKVLQTLFKQSASHEEFSKYEPIEVHQALPITRAALFKKLTGSRSTS